MLMMEIQMKIQKKEMCILITQNNFGKHNIEFTGVGEYNDFTNNNFNAGGQQYLIPQIQDNDLGSSINPLFNTAWFVQRRICAGIFSCKIKL